MNRYFPFSTRVLLLGIILGLAISGCDSAPAESSETASLNESSVASDSSTETVDSTSTDSTSLAAEYGDTTLTDEGDGLRVAYGNDSGPPIPKPDDIDPTRIFEDPLEEPEKPGTKGDPARFNSGGFVGCWTDSREENRKNPGFKIFRPCEFKKFPPARFRFRMDLQAGGACTWLWLAPNDGHRMKPGTWNYDMRTKVLTIKDEDGEEVRRYDVVEIDRSILKVKAG